MQITGVEHIIFGVEDMDGAKRFLNDYGLKQVDASPSHVRYEALDGSGVEIRSKDDPSLPPAITGGSTARLTVWGVKDRQTLEAIRAELSKDRDVTGDDLVISKDDDGHTIGFRVTQRRGFSSTPALANAPGHRGRPINDFADFKTTGTPRVLGHVVYWSENAKRAMDFYIKRLGFLVTDSVGEGDKISGVFARAAGHPDHHSIFFLNNMGGKFPASMQHVEFQFKDFQEVMVNGQMMADRGWKTHMGPGRHLIGSNWTWYFYTPVGCLFEISADMDQVDEGWKPRIVSPAENMGLRPSFVSPGAPGKPIMGALISGK